MTINFDILTFFKFEDPEINYNNKIYVYNIDVQCNGFTIRTYIA